MVLIIATIYQISLLWPRITFDLTESRRVLHKHSMWRNAYFHRSERFANLIQFLNENIPGDATVMLPPDDVVPATLGNTIEMSYFLQMRPIVKCQQRYYECIDEHVAEGAYAIFSGDVAEMQNRVDFEPERIIQQDTYAVILPKQKNPSPNLPITDFNSWFEIAGKLILPTLFLLILTSLGFFLVNNMFYEFDPTTKLAIGYGLSLGIYSILVFLCLFISDGELSYLIIFGCLAGMGALFTGIVWIIRKIKPSKKQPMKQFKLDHWQLIIVLYCLVQLFISFGRAYSGVDEIRNWAIRGYAIAEYNLVDGTSNYGGLTTAFPPHLHILIAVFKWLFSDSVPESKIIFPLYGLMLLFLVYDFIHKRTPRPIPGLAVIFIAFIPLIYTHFNKGFANLPATYFFITAMMLIMLAIEENEAMKRTALYSLASIFLIFIAWARSEGAVIGIVIILMVTLIWGKQLARNHWRSYALFFILPYLLFFIFWQHASGVIYSHQSLDDDLFATIIRNIGQGRWYISSIGIIIRVFYSYLTSGIHWGIVAFTGVVSLLLCIMDRKLNKTSVKQLLLPFTYLMMVFLAYYSSAFVIEAAAGRVYSGLLRLIMPAMISGWVLLQTMVFDDHPTIEKDRLSSS